MGIIIDTKCNNWFLTLLEVGWLAAIAKNAYSWVIAPPELKGINAAGTITAAGIGYVIIKAVEKPICK